MEKKILRITAILLAVESPEVYLVVIYRKNKKDMETDPCDTIDTESDYIPDCGLHFLKLSINFLYDSTSPTLGSQPSALSLSAFRLRQISGA